MDMKAKTKEELDKLYVYLTPLGEDRERMFKHLMFVNHRNSDTFRELNKIHEDIKQRNYKLKTPEQRYKIVFDSVLKELKDKKESIRVLIEEEYLRNLQKLEQRTLHPGEFRDNEIPSIGFFMNLIGPENEVNGWIYPKQEDYYGVPYMNLSTRDKSTHGFDYEESMDVKSSLEFIHEIVFSKGKNAFPFSSPAPNEFTEVYKAVTSCLLKINDELSTSYLRGCRDTSKKIESPFVALGCQCFRCKMMRTEKSK